MAANCSACRVAKTVAEREGFEPSIELLALCSLSKRVPSASRSSPLGTRPSRFSSACELRHAWLHPWAAIRLSESAGRERLAEEEGFEPPASFNATVFKTVAFDRSATPPVVRGRLHSAGARVCKA